MATASTKRRGKRKSPSPRAAASAPTATAETDRVSKKFWLLASLIIVGVAALLRLYALELKPMHHDEGVNGFFLTGLVRNWQYAYQPDNYHGPTLYYFALPFTWAFGLKTWAVRLVPVAFGMGTVGLMLCLRRYIGTVGALTAAALVAVSPGAVYYSRYFIHEMMFVFFTVGIVVAALKFYEETPNENANLTFGIIGAGCAWAAAALAFALTLVLAFAVELSIDPQSLVTEKRIVVITSSLLFAASFVMLALYEGDRAIYLLLASVSAALMFGTKETAFISAVVLVLAALVGRLWVTYYGRARGGPTVESAGKGIITRAGGWPRLILMLVAAVFVFVFVHIVFYTSIFTNPKGLLDSFQALEIWTKTGTSEFHGKPWYTYVKWLVYEESPLLILGAAGSALALFIGRNRFAVFAGAWAFGMMAAYSLVYYKTPWLVLSFTVPMAIAGGYAVRVVDNWARREKRTRWPAIGIVAAAVAVCTYQTLVLNFREYDNDRYPYVYSHTRRDFNLLVKEIKTVAERAGTSTDTRIAVTSTGSGTDSYWPLPWYLNDFKSVGYHAGVPPEAAQMAIVVGNATQDAQLRESLAATHRKIGGIYQLRPGVDLVLYARRDYVRR